MANQNVYAASIFAKNPTAVWALDEDFYSINGETPLSPVPGVNLTANGFEASSYGTNQFPGYYLSTTLDADFNDLKANNYGVPLVFGANTATNLYPNPHYVGQTISHYDPSLIIPGLGFLNKEGIGNNLTLEMWLRVQSEAHYPVRIVGPISSSDGLYTNGPFLSLRVGDSIGHHYVGEWGRPMLIHMIYTPSAAYLMLNGEQVISIKLSESDKASMPEGDTLDETSSTIQYLSNDWIGFYAHEKVNPLQVDCVAIYPYRVSPDLAKVNFVKGQAVESPEKKNAAYSDVPISIDFQYAKNANTYTYPGLGSWQNGISSNMKTTYGAISVPEYKLPDFKTQDTRRGISEWYTFHEETQTPVDSLADGQMMPSSTYFRLSDKDLLEADQDWDSESFLSFPNMSPITDKVRSVYALVELPATISDQTLLRIRNGSHSFEILLRENSASSAIDYSIDYVFKNNGLVVETLDSVLVSPSEMVGIGLSFQDLVNAFPQSPNLSAFFGNVGSLKVDFGGSGSFLDTFTGKIFRIAFSNSADHDRLLQDFFTNGMFNISSSSVYASDLLDVITSYTLFPTFTFDSFALDIAVCGEFSDHIPLGMLAKPTLQADGTLSDTLDGIQFAIDFPDYSINNSIVKTYVRFLNILSQEPVATTEANNTLNGLLTVGAGQTSRYPIQNQTFFYVPDTIKNNTSSYAIETIVEFSIPGIFRNPLSLGKMSISSYTVDKAVGSKTPIGTRHGKDIFQYSVNQSGAVSNNSCTPYMIYKDSTPYMYFTNYSGIRNVGVADGTYGIEIPMNSSAANNYIVSVMQASILHRQQFPSQEVEIFRANAFDSYNKPVCIVIFAKRSDANGYVADVYAKYYDPTASTPFTPCPDISIHVNGIEHDDYAESSIRYKEWFVLSISFTNFLYFNKQSSGNVRISGPFLVNNFTDYQLMPYQVGKSRTFRSWETASTLFLWNQVDTEKQWADVWVAGEEPVDGLSLENIYNSYFGSSIIQSSPPGNSLLVKDVHKNIYNGASASLIIKKPV